MESSQNMHSSPLATYREVSSSDVVTAISPPTTSIFPSPSMIDTLPMEVLHAIFCLACDGEYRLEIRPYSSPFQHVLMRVCRRWHSSIGRSASHLSVSYYAFGHYHVGHTAYSLSGDIPSCHRRFLRDALQRYMRSVFHCTLHVHGKANPDIPLPPAITDILTDIVSSSERWCSLDLDLSHAPLQFLLPIHHNIPRLCSLLLQHHQDKSEAMEKEARQSLSLIFDDAPNLTLVRSTIFQIGYEFPWDQLLELTLRPSHMEGEPHGIDFMAYLRNIRKCTRIQRFTCGCNFERKLSSMNHDFMITHPSLHDLSIENMIPFDLQILVLPALDTLALHFENTLNEENSKRSIQECLAFTERSNCRHNIHSFSLSHSHPARVLDMIHPCLPNVQYLQVRLYSFTVVFDFLNFLRVRDFFPILEELDLSIQTSSSYLTDLSIEAMLRRLFTVATKQDRRDLARIVVSLDTWADNGSSEVDLAEFKSESPALMLLKEVKMPMVDVYVADWTGADLITYDLLTSNFERRQGGQWPKRDT